MYSESILLGRMHLTALSQNGKTLLCICVLWIYPFRKGMHLTAHCPKSGKTLSYICVLWIYPFRKGMHPHYTVPKVEKLSHISVHSEFILLGRMHLTILYTVPKEVILPVSEHSVSILLGRMHLTILYSVHCPKRGNSPCIWALCIYPLRKDAPHCTVQKKEKSLVFLCILNLSWQHCPKSIIWISALKPSRHE